jgi:hypothetical protein
VSSYPVQQFPLIIRRSVVDFLLIGWAQYNLCRSALVGRQRRTFRQLLETGITVGAHSLEFHGLGLVCLFPMLPCDDRALR